MRSIRYGMCLLLVAAFNAFAGNYSPFFDPYVEPANPTTYEDVRWIALWKGCGALGTPTISLLGQRITVRWPIQAVCGVPLGGHALVNLGRLPAGTYTVHVVPCDVGFGTFEDPCYVMPSPPDVSFSVAAAASVPSLGRAGSFAMVLLLTFVGAASAQARLRRKDSQR